MASKKDRANKRTTKFHAAKPTVGIEELRGYYFAHGDHGAGSKFNKTVEKIAEYCRVEVIGNLQVNSLWRRSRVSRSGRAIRQ